jgi:hypothetical protein
MEDWRLIVKAAEQQSRASRFATDDWRSALLLPRSTNKRKRIFKDRE